MVHFQTKNLNLGKFLIAFEWKMIYTLRQFGISYRHWGYFMTICHILGSFGTFCPVLVSFAKKNLATVRWTRAALLW
jgi:hypothetical protein